MARKTVKKRAVRKKKPAKKYKTHILKLDKDDPEKELDFDVRCALERPVAMRISVMLEVSRRMLVLARKYADRRAYKIIQRS
jgi:hypothetical protein